MTMDDISSVLCEITSTQIDTLNLIDNIHRPKDFRMKRSLLPFGRLFHFLFGTAKEKDVKSKKQDIKRLYDNQITQSKVLGLINENILKINQIIRTITFLYDMMDSTVNQIKTLFSARRFLLLHTETLMHHVRIRLLLGQMHTDTAQIRDYLKIHITGKLT